MVRSPNRVLTPAEKYLRSGQKSSSTPRISSFVAPFQNEDLGGIKSRCILTGLCMWSDAMHRIRPDAMRCMQSDAIFLVQNHVVSLQIDACGLMRCGLMRCGLMRCGLMRCGACGLMRCGLMRFSVYKITLYVYRSMHAV